MYNEIVILLLCIASIAGCQTVSHEPTRFEDMHGLLQVPFGTIVEVEGVVVENDQQSKADLDYQWFFAIESVNGQSLNQVVQYGVPSQKDNRIDTNTWSIGDRRQLVVYETGGYRGAPDGLFDYYSRSFAIQGFHFHRSLVIVAENVLDE